MLQANPQYTSADLLVAQGFSYPFNLSGSARRTAGLDYYREGIRAYLDWFFFELLMKPEGSRIHEVLYDPLDEAMIKILEVYVKDALANFKQIRIISISCSIPNTFETSGHEVKVAVKYMVFNPRLMDQTTLSYPVTLGVSNSV